MADDPTFSLTGIAPQPQMGDVLRPTESYAGPNAATNVMDLPEWNPAQFKPPTWDQITSSDKWSQSSDQDRMQAARNWADHVYQYGVGNGDDPAYAKGQRDQFVSNVMDAIFPPQNPVEGTAKAAISGAFGTAGSQASGLSGAAAAAQKFAEENFGANPMAEGEGYFSTPGMTPEEISKQATPVPQALSAAGEALKGVAAEAAPNEGFQRHHPILNTVGNIAGSIVPYGLESAVSGPVGPVLGAYGQGVDQAVSAADAALKQREANGEAFTPDQRADILNKAAGFGNLPGIAQAVGMAALNIFPETRGLMQLAAKLGINIGTQGVAGAASKLAENYAVQSSGANPQQNLYAGLGESALQQAGFGAAFTGAHALGELPRVLAGSRVESTAPQPNAPISQPGAFNGEVANLPRLRAMAYGPSQGEYTHDTLNGPLGKLQQGDIAVSPNLLNKYPMGSRVDVVDDHGNVVVSGARVADTSYIKPGQPTYNSFEIWNGEDLGHARLVPSNGEPVSVQNYPEEERQIASQKQQTQQPREAQVVPNIEENIPQGEPPASGVVQNETQVKQPVSGPDDWVSAIANRYTGERSLSGELGEIAPGQGYATEDLVNRGMRMGPQELNQRIQDFRNNTGDPVLNAAAIRAKEAQLSAENARTGRIADANPADPQAKANADSAFNALTDFHNNVVAPLKNNWHAQGMAMQGEIPVDLSNFNSMREQFLSDVGRPPTEQESVGLQAAARKVANAAEAHEAAMNKLEVGVKKAASRVKDLPSYDDLKTRIMQAMNDLPCPR